MGTPFNNPVTRSTAISVQAGFQGNLKSGAILILSPGKLSRPRNYKNFQKNENALWFSLMTKRSS
jgi:hypothetical protein